MLSKAGHISMQLWALPPLALIGCGVISGGVGGALLCSDWAECRCQTGSLFFFWGGGCWFKVLPVPLHSSPVDFGQRVRLNYVANKSLLSFLGFLFLPLALRWPEKTKTKLGQEGGKC